MFTTSFRQEAFHSINFIRTFQEWVWIKSNEQNNKLIKACGGASDLLNNVDNSALIRWETCSLEIARVMLEFKDCLDQNEILAESSTRHHKDSQTFHERFSYDFNRLIKCITVNPFMQDHLTKCNSKKSLFQSLRVL